MNRDWWCRTCLKSHIDCTCGNQGLVTTNGCFDGLHPGHLFFLGFCRAQGSRLIVGINTDEYIIRRKRPLPIPQDQRQRDLLELGFVDSVVIFQEDDPNEFLNIIKPDIHCIGEEYKDTAAELDVCRKLGVRIVYVPRIGRWSSTSIRGVK